MFTSAIITALGVGFAFLWPAIRILVDLMGVLILLFICFGVLRLVVRVFLPKQ